MVPNNRATQGKPKGSIDVRAGPERSRVKEEAYR